MYYLLMTENTGGLANACVRFFTDREKASEMAQKGLKARSEIMSDDANVIRIVHQDPAEENLPPFWPFVYRDGKLVSRVIVTDMDPPETIFEKVE